VEDDESLGFLTKDNLEREGYEIFHFADGLDALEAVKHKSFDLAILDIMLPEIDGFTIARVLRERDREIPILFLSAKSMKEDRIQGFSIGADDYITKPFSIEELLFKIKIFLKRSKIHGPDHRNIFRLGLFELDHANLTLRKDQKQERILTQKEADVLLYLIKRENQICKRSLILEKIWGEDDYFMGRSLDVFISRLRKYLAHDQNVQIDNIHGVGFKLRILNP
jgi:DNA-binding response OmpR family regulator